MTAQRLTITRKPPEHGTGKGSGPCTCKGKTGTLVGIDKTLLFVRLDKGGRVGVPTECVRFL